MHTQAYEWVQRYATTRPVAVLDIGGRDVNGSPRPLFPNAQPYRVVDSHPGDGVDVVCDASTWVPDGSYDVVVCCEVFEHTPDWRKICLTAWYACKPGGRLIVTTAAPGRPEHSAMDGRQLRDGEYYGNVEPADLWTALDEVGWENILVDAQYPPADVRAVATRPVKVTVGIDGVDLPSRVSAG